MVLLSAAIVFAGLGWIGLSDSDDGSSGAATTAATPTEPPAATPATGTGGAPGTGSGTSSRSTSASASTTQSADAGENSAALLRVPVRVYNNSTVDGLAATTADQLRAEGWTVTDALNYDSGQVPQSAVYYGTAPGEREAAEKVAQELGFAAEPRFEGILDAPPGVIVILAGDSAN